MQEQRLRPRETCTAIVFNSTALDTMLAESTARPHRFIPGTATTSRYRLWLWRPKINNSTQAAICHMKVVRGKHNIGFGITGAEIYGTGV